MGGVVGAGVLWGGWDPAPKLALDLQGGTQIILEPLIAEGAADVTTEQLEQAVTIIRQRVDATGVSEAEISTLGTNIVVAIPGQPDQATLDRLQASAKLEFRAVLVAGAPSATTAGDGTDADGDGTPDPTPSATPDPAATPDAAATPSATPTDGSDLAWVTPELQAEFDAFDCASLASATTNVAPADEPLITCETDLSIKYILGPVEVDGSNISDARAGQVLGSNGANTGRWAIYPTFDDAGTAAFADITTRLVGLASPRDQFAAVLDGKVLIAPATQAAITNGKPEITGSFTQETATSLASQLKFGALPVSFEAQSQESISATLGESQLASGLIAGGIGLILVVIYSFFQYRALASVTIASLVVAALITYLTVTILSWGRLDYRLSLAGVAGLIVAIGFTVDSFIVYFERIRDELRDGKRLTSAVEAGWRRALRTIYAAKGVTLLSAVVLYIVAVGNVKGFAFTLGITVIIDVLVVVLFTHPMLQLLATRPFFSSGHPLSGLDPQALGAVYRGRAEFRPSTEARKAGASREAGKRQTIAERKAAESASTPSKKSTESKGKK
ncbi:protein translocase subunit SecD [Pseudolysinimonas sp.]|uniref:protein translocase subunit SecD n=1 Tax=Pseudolysinimonas sp. TaxID=2680009 RepID=UPI00286A37CD|nr:protein translocase subunit SecD [Pseudolysinimonas sp.]